MVGVAFAVLIGATVGRKPHTGEVEKPTVKAPKAPRQKRQTTAPQPVTPSVTAAPVVTQPAQPAPDLPHQEDARVNLNTATVEQLYQIKYFTEAMAQEVYAYRTQNGAIRSLDELAVLPGFGATRLQQIAPYVTLGN